MKKYILFLLIMSFSNLTYAASFSSYYCEKGFRNVNVGDTVEVVRAACGEPSAINNRTDQVNKPVEAERWVYALGTFNIKNTFVTLPSVTLIFRDKKVIEIQRMGSSVVNASCSFTGVVHVGDTAEQVIMTCGNPNHVDRTQQAVAAPKMVTEWVYNNGPYKPQIIFELEEGRVTQISSGQLGK